jgi:hypothetical protein
VTFCFASTVALFGIVSSKLLLVTMVVLH